MRLLLGTKQINRAEAHGETADSQDECNMKKNCVLGEWKENFNLARARMQQLERDPSVIVASQTYLE